VLQEQELSEDLSFSTVYNGNNLYLKYMPTPVNSARAFLNSGSRNRQRAAQLFNAVLNSENPNNSVMNRLANIITPAAHYSPNVSYSVRSYVNNSNSNNEVTSRAPRYTATQPNIHPEILRQARRTLLGNFNSVNTNLNSTYTRGKASRAFKFEYIWKK
jgi:hypothetical protein